MVCPRDAGTPSEWFGKVSRMEIRRLTFTFTRRRTLRVHFVPVRAHCPVCARVVDTLDAAQAAAALAVSDDRLQEMLAAAVVHGLPTVSGSLRICQESLFPR
jgi:hypothetical protein